MIVLLKVCLQVQIQNLVLIIGIIIPYKNCKLYHKNIVLNKTKMNLNEWLYFQLYNC